MPIWGIAGHQLTFLLLHIFQAQSLEVKQTWVKRLRELIQERLMYISSALKEPITKGPIFKATSHKVYNHRSSR